MATTGPTQASVRRPGAEPKEPRDRGLLALALAGLAAALAVVGAVGPAERERATYAWPPRTLPASEPRDLWFSPLLLTARSPARLDVRVPCRGRRVLSGASDPLMLVATTREPESGGLFVTASEDGLTFSVGSAAIASVTPAAGPEDEPCAVRIVVDGGRWRLSGPGVAEDGDLGGVRPVVFGLFTELDLRRGPRPEVALTTEPVVVRPMLVQRIAWILAAGLAILALALAARVRLSRRPLARLAARAASLLRHARPVDGVVLAALAVWWLVGPVLFDDGWVKVRQTNYDAAEGFSNYYTTYGANLALDFWLEWLQHWVIAPAQTLLVLRLPALALLGALWALSRWVLAAVTRDVSPAAGAEWALGLVFVVNTYAWAMTLRPEPAIALLLVGVLACAVRFSQRAAAAPLAVAAVLLALALTAHPAGLVAAAPLVVIAPRVVSWRRAEGWMVPGAVVLAAAALVVVLLTVGSDIWQRMDEARMARTVGDAVAGWREELTRYEFRGAEATTLRRASVALLLAAVLGYLLRPNRSTARLLDLPAASLGVALLLLIPTPSKWAWHFGALTGIAALAVAAEIARVRISASVVRPLLALVVAVLVTGWSWSPRVNWSSGLDLRTYDWTLSLEDRIPLVRLVSALPLLVLAACAAVLFVRRGLPAVRAAPRMLVPFLVPMAVVPLLVFNLAVLVQDARATPQWTLARQNVSSLAGRSGCGLADDTTVADPATFTALRAVAPAPLEPPASGARPAPPFAGLEVLGRSPGAEDVVTPWYELPADGRRVGFYVSSIAAQAGELSARWATAGGGSVLTDWTPAATSSPRMTRADASPWSFVPEGALPPRPSGARAVQLRLRSTETPPRRLLATGAVAYGTAPLTELLTSPGARPFVAPNLVLYLPCARLPTLARGIVEPPTLVVLHDDLWPVEYDSSPFLGVLDLYGLRDLSVLDSSLPPKGVHVYALGDALAGAALAPAEERRAS